MNCKMIDIISEEGQLFQGYLSLPRDGRGPGIILLQEIYGVNAQMRATADVFAEEGYVVLVPDLFWRLQPGIQLGYDAASRQQAFDYLKRFDLTKGLEDIASTMKALRRLTACTGKIAVVGFCLGGKLAFLSAARFSVDAAVAFYGGGIDKYLEEAGAIKCPMVLHFGGRDDHIPPKSVQLIREAFAGRGEIESMVYPDAQHGFYRSGSESFHRPSALMAHTRTIALLRKIMGPTYDLSAIWEKHCEYEFDKRDVDATMTTMVDEPYVNHVPTMTGGVGYRELHRFYKNHFLARLPKDTRIVSISRTVGADRVVDELLFCFTHDTEIDFMLPGVPPTGKYVEVPTVAIVRFRGDKLYNEHIYWDQASVLVQIGLLDPKGLPIAGIETARKLVDETLPSNTLMQRWAESEPN